MATSREYSIAVSEGMVTISMGNLEARAPVGQLERLGKLVQTARDMVGLMGGDALSSEAAAPAPKARRAASAPAKAAPAKKARAKKARAVKSDAAEPTKQAAADTKKRRSRKRVGDTLSTWMQSNPGWHNEEQLLQAVIDHEMTDAAPKRALKIALGKARGTTFDSDGRGHWKLLSDEDAGPPPAPPRRRRKPKAKPGKAKSRGGALKAARKSKRATPKGAPKGTRKTRLRAKKRTTPPEGGDDTSGPAGAAAGEGEGRKTALLVKKGQDRKAAAMPEGETERREEATARVRSKKRWQRVTDAELAKARRNLLGLGGE